MMSCTLLMILNMLSVIARARAVAALGCIELPREVDADTAAIAILLELRTDIDTTVCGHLYVAGVKDVVGKNGYAEVNYYWRDGTFDALEELRTRELNHRTYGNGRGL